MREVSVCFAMSEVRTGGMGRDQSGHDRLRTSWRRGLHPAGFLIFVYFHSDVSSSHSALLHIITCRDPNFHTYTHTPPMITASFVRMCACTRTCLHML